MGIAASVLIFISLILFATLLLPKLNDPAKMVIMYLVSAAFLGVGALRMYKDKENSFNIALTGCGLGALFISLLLSLIARFKAILCTHASVEILIQLIIKMLLGIIMGIGYLTEMVPIRKGVPMLIIT